MTTNATPEPLQVPEDPALRARIATLIAEHEAKTSQQQDAIAAGIRFVFCAETTVRQIGGDVWVKNRFGDKTGGTIINRVSEHLYMVQIFDNRLIPVHEPDMVWFE